jgi:xanthine dehydrogenase accessory factor
VAVLTHDPKFDDPALMIALRSPAMYVGAIGSKKTQAARRERLRAAGLTEAQVEKLFGPIGLDLGGRSPAETALAIMAEIVAVRHGATAARKGG